MKLTKISYSFENFNYIGELVQNLLIQFNLLKVQQDLGGLKLVKAFYDGLSKLQNSSSNNNTLALTENKSGFNIFHESIILIIK